MHAIQKKITRKGYLIQKTRKHRFDCLGTNHYFWKLILDISNCKKKITIFIFRLFHKSNFYEYNIVSYQIFHSYLFCSCKLLMNNEISVLYRHSKLYNSCLTIYKDKVSHNTRCNRVQVPQQTKPAAGGRKTTVHFFLFSNYIRSSVAW